MKSAVSALMNKLLEDKRYNDVLKLAQRELAKFDIQIGFPDVNSEFTNIVAHAALEIVILNLYYICYRIFKNIVIL